MLRQRHYGPSTINHRLYNTLQLLRVPRLVERTTSKNDAISAIVLRILQDYRADGVIFAGGALNEPGHPEQLKRIVQAMVDRGGAVVTLAQHTLDVPSVQADNFG